MVRLGIICEGKTEQILFTSRRFTELLRDLNIFLVNVIDAEGAGNLLPHNIDGYIESLELEGAEKILIVSDLDGDACITSAKKRVGARRQDDIVIVVKEIEAWFLCCSGTLGELLNVPDFKFDSPENENDPYATINDLHIHHKGQGIGRKSHSGKIKLIYRLLEHNLNLSEALRHDNCASVNYFFKKIKQIGAAN